MTTILLTNAHCPNVSVDHAVQCIMSYNRGALLAKLDIESGYQIIPYILMIALCLEWCGK